MWPEQGRSAGRIDDVLNKVLNCLRIDATFGAVVRLAGVELGGVGAHEGTARDHANERRGNFARGSSGATEDRGKFACRGLGEVTEGSAASVSVVPVATLPRCDSELVGGRLLTVRLCEVHCGWGEERSRVRTGQVDAAFDARDRDLRGVPFKLDRWIWKGRRLVSMLSALSRSRERKVGLGEASPRPIHAVTLHRLHRSPAPVR